LSGRHRLILTSRCSAIAGNTSRLRRCLQTGDHDSSVRECLPRHEACSSYRSKPTRVTRHICSNFALSWNRRSCAGNNLRDRVQRRRESATGWAFRIDPTRQLVGNSKMNSQTHRKAGDSHPALRFTMFTSALLITGPHDPHRSSGGWLCREFRNTKSLARLGIRPEQHARQLRRERRNMPLSQRRRGFD
jgi:hypothetical protein